MYASAAGPWRPLTVGLVVVGSGLLAAVTTGVLVPWSVLVAALGYLLGAVLVSAYWQRPRFGAANGVTLARFVGCCWIAALTAEAALRGLADADRLLLIGLASVCLILDGVDGRVARARGEVSAFGAHFDEETDALLLLCLSVTVPVLGVAGWWALLLSALRYGYLALSWAMPVLRIPLAVTLAGKVVAVIAAVTLIAALAVDLIWPGRPATVILLFGLACLVWSFARSIIWQVRHHQVERSSVA